MYSMSTMIHNHPLSSTILHHPFLSAEESLLRFRWTAASELMTGSGASRGLGPSHQAAQIHKALERYQRVWSECCYQEYTNPTHHLRSPHQAWCRQHLFHPCLHRLGRKHLSQTIQIQSSKQISNCSQHLSTIKFGDPQHNFKQLMASRDHHHQRYRLSAPPSVHPFAASSTAAPGDVQSVPRVHRVDRAMWSAADSNWALNTALGQWHWLWLGRWCNSNSSCRALGLLPETWGRHFCAV